MNALRLQGKEREPADRSLHSQSGGQALQIKEAGAGFYHNHPKDYRFCGYGDAMGGSTQARRGIGKVMCLLSADKGWKEAAREYRKLLYVVGEAQGTTETGQPKKRGFQPEKVEEVMQADGNPDAKGKS
jgi:putative transposase